MITSVKRANKRRHCWLRPKSGPSIGPLKKFVENTDKEIMLIKVDRLSSWWPQQTNWIVIVA